MRFALSFCLLLAIRASPLFAQMAVPATLERPVAPDSTDYALWSREAGVRGLRSFTVTTLDIDASGSHPDTLGTHYGRVTFTRAGTHVLLRADHPIAEEGDSLQIEFDSAGHPIAETQYANGRSISIERWRYDTAGRLERDWYEYAEDGWHAPQEFFYDENGAIERVELRNPDGSLQGNHFFYRPSTPDRANLVMEYDTSYINGHGMLTAIQLTAFDYEGRVERYLYRSLGFDRKLRPPFGFLNVYRDSARVYKMQQFPLKPGPGNDERVSYLNEPSRWLRYDSTERTDEETSLDSTGMKITERDRFLEDERFLSSDLRSARAPIQNVECHYTPRGLLESIRTENRRTGWTRVLVFTYTYTLTGP